MGDTALAGIPVTIPLIVKTRFRIRRMSMPVASRPAVTVTVLAWLLFAVAG
jgi:hypothetical protein